MTIECSDDQETPKKIKETYKCKGAQLIVYKIDKVKKEILEKGKKARMLYAKKDYHDQWINVALPVEE